MIVAEKSDRSPYTSPPMRAFLYLYLTAIQKTEISRSYHVGLIIIKISPRPCVFVWFK